MNRLRVGLRQALAAVSFLVLLGACGGGGSGDRPPPSLGGAADYWAAGAASRWVYDGRDNTQAGASYRDQVTLGAPLDRFGRRLARFDYTRPFNNPAGPVAQYRSFAPAEGIRAYLETTPGDFAQSYIELPAQIRPQTYRAFESTTNVPGGTRTVHIDVTIVGTTRVTVPAGSFANALQTVHRHTVTTRGAEATQTTVVQLTLWYAKGLGIVKQQLDDPGSEPPVASYVEELAGVTVPGTRAGVVGEFTVLDDLSAPMSALTTGRPGIAGDGSGYLVAARALDAAFEGRIVAAYLDGTGRTVWQKTVIDGLGADVLEYGPIAVTFDGADFWIAARSDHGVEPGVVRQRVSPGGELRDPPQGVYVGGHWPALASNGDSVLLTVNRNLGPPNHEWGRFVTLFNRDGTVQRGKRLLLAGASTGAQTAQPHATNNGQYLVTLDSGDISGVRVDAAGNVLDLVPITISAAVASQGGSVIAPWGSGFVALWLDPRHYGDRLAPVFDVFGARVSAEGRVLDGPPATGGVALNRAPSERFGLGVASGTMGTLAVWTADAVSTGPTPPAGVFARHFAPGADFSVADPHAQGVLIQPLSSLDTGVRLMAPASAASRDGYAVVWVRNDETSGRTKSVRGALVFPPVAH